MEHFCAFVQTPTIMHGFGYNRTGMCRRVIWENVGDRNFDIFLTPRSYLHWDTCYDICSTSKMTYFGVQFWCLHYALIFLFLIFQDGGWKPFWKVSIPAKGCSTTNMTNFGVHNSLLMFALCFDFRINHNSKWRPVAIWKNTNCQSFS